MAKRKLHCNFLVLQCSINMFPFQKKNLWAIKSDSQLLHSVPWRPRFLLQFWLLEVSIWGRRCQQRKERWQNPKVSLTWDKYHLTVSLVLAHSINLLRVKIYVQQLAMCLYFRVSFYMATYREGKKCKSFVSLKVIT